MKFRKKSYRLLYILPLLFGLNAIAATITLTSPTTPVSFMDGEDFFTDIVNDPVDFDKRRDIRWEEHFTESSVTVTGGIWSGAYNGVTVGGSGAYIFPHFQGVPGSLSTGFCGAQHILDTSKYRYVSVMDRVSNSTVRRMYWSRDDNWPGVACTSCKTTGVDGTFQTGSTSENDGYYTNTWVYHGSDQWVIYLIDLRAKTEWTDAPVTGIRFDASAQGPAGTTLDFKWFRAVDPDTSPTLDITWNTGIAPPGSKVNIYIDTDGIAGDYNGAFLTRAAAADGSFSFPTAALPAGGYYVYLRLMDNIGSDTELARSAYSAPVTINGKGRIEFISPSKTSGPDYATEVLDNPWDMEAATDIANLDKPSYQQCFENELFVDGIFEATAVIDPDQANTSHSDVQVWMTIDDQNPVDTARYRYLTYTMEVDPSHHGNISDKVSGGWIARAIWWSAGLGIDGEQTNDNVVYEGLHSYTIDLATVEIEPASVLSGTRWTDNPTVANLRIDPLETSNPEGTRFYLHDVKLTADPEPVNHKFEAVLNLHDAESEKLTVAFYLDTNTEGYDGIYLGSKNYAPGEQKFQFNTCKLDLGDYYLYVIMTDEYGNTTRRYADVPIHNGAPAPEACPVLPVIINYLLM